MFNRFLRPIFLIQSLLQTSNPKMYNKITRALPILLKPNELTETLISLPKWKLIDNQLKREIVLSDFETTWSFLNQVAMRSHLWGHHPTINTVYNRVNISLTTHDANGITDIDIKMAIRIEKFIQVYTNKINAIDKQKD